MSSSSDLASLRITIWIRGAIDPVAIDEDETHLQFMYQDPALQIPVRSPSDTNPREIVPDQGGDAMDFAAKARGIVLVSRQGKVDGIGRFMLCTTVIGSVV